MNVDVVKGTVMCVIGILVKVGNRRVSGGNPVRSGGRDADAAVCVAQIVEGKEYCDEGCTGTTEDSGLLMILCVLFDK